MNLFLRAKHWQLFILIMGSAALTGMVTLLSSFFNLLFLVTLFGWIYAVAVGMQKMLPATLKMKVMVFKVFLIIPFVYSILLFIFFDSFSKSFGDPFFGAGAFIIIPVHVFSIFCMFYCFYFMAKTIKTVELQRTATFGDFIPEFCLVWIFPIGLWILQPRINKMVKQYAGNN